MFQFLLFFSSDDNDDNDNFWNELENSESDNEGNLDINTGTLEEF